MRLGAGLLAAAAALFAGPAAADKVELPRGCIALATVVGADCSVRHVARCADFSDGASTFQTDAAGRLRERVDRARGLVAARVWRPVEGEEGPLVGLGVDRANVPLPAPLDDLFIEIDLREALSGFSQRVVRLEVVQRARTPDGAGLALAAQRLRDLKPGGRLTLGLDLVLTEAATASRGARRVSQLIQRAVRAPDATARVLGGERRLRVYRLAVRDGAGALALSETRYYDPQLRAVIGRRLDGVVDGAPERRDGTPIAVFTVGRPGLLAVDAAQRVAACVR